jgi:hypothetical protein
MATTKQSSMSTDIILKPGEAAFGTVSNVSLVEDRRGPGHYSGVSQGVSIPIGSVGGHSVRYRVGASRGHYVQGSLHPEAVDTGNLVITNQRVLFVGGRKTVECLFAKLVNANVEAGHSFTFCLEPRESDPPLLRRQPRRVGASEADAGHVDRTG